MSESLNMCVECEISVLSVAHEQNPMACLPWPVCHASVRSAVYMTAVGSNTHRELQIC